MKFNKKLVSLILILILLFPLIPMPFQNNQRQMSTAPLNLEIDYDKYRASNVGQSEANISVIEQTIFNLVNELREEKDLAQVQANDMLKAGAIIRAQESAETFAHTRPNGTEPFTVLNEGEIIYNYRTVGENLAMATYFLEDDEMAQFIFDGWVESEGHYETMVNPKFEEVGIGVHFDGEIIYATQLFGTQR
jgi:uncharacterized protein YkwD